MSDKLVSLIEQMLISTDYEEIWQVDRDLKMMLKLAKEQRIEIERLEHEILIGCERLNN